MAQVLKADINFWRRDMAPSKVNEKESEALKADLDSAKTEIENCNLQKEGRQVASTIAGYAIKKVIKEKSCARNAQKNALLHAMMKAQTILTPKSYLEEG